MATIEAIKVEILEPMTRHFDADKRLSSAEQSAALQDYANALKSFSYKALADGWGSILRSHKFRRWPTVAEIISACENAEPADERGYSGPQVDDRAWAATMQTLERQYGAACRKSWFDKLGFTRRSGVVELNCPGAFYADWIKANYLSEILRHFQAHDKSPVVLTWPDRAGTFHRGLAEQGRAA